MPTVEWRRGNEHGVYQGVPPGRTPAILLCDPKYPHNVGQVVRLAACYQIPQVWITGDRVQLTNTVERIPREERMRDYASVTLYRHDRPTQCFLGNPAFICIEYVPNAETLPTFTHPARAVYVFGPEDGGVPKAIRGHCWRFVRIPTLHCLNLATAVATVLYDRARKSDSGDGHGTDIRNVAGIVG